MLGWNREMPSLGTTFVDEEAEVRKAGILLAVIAAALISGFISYRELKFALFAVNTEATVTRTYVFTVPTRHGRSGPRLGVEFLFDDESGQQRSAKDWVAMPSNLANVKKVAIQYLPDEELKARLTANRSWLGPTVFALCVMGSLWSLASLVREANTPIRPRGRRR